jgi:hypothetical protein
MPSMYLILKLVGSISENTYFQSESPSGALASRDADPDFVLPIAPRLVVFKLSAVMENGSVSEWERDKDFDH